MSGCGKLQWIKRTQLQPSAGIKGFTKPVFVRNAMQDQVFGTKMNIWFNQFNQMSDNFILKSISHDKEVSSPPLKSV